METSNHSTLTAQAEAFLDSVGMNFFQLFAALGNEQSKLLCLPSDDQTQFIQIYDKLESGNYHRNEKGTLLERLTSILFDRNIFQSFRNVRTSSNELDLLVSWRESSGLLQLKSAYPCFGESFICECKNYSGAVNVTYVGEFCSLLRLASCNLGIMVSWNGVTGLGGWSAANGLIRKVALKENIFIVILDKNDLKKIYNRETNIFSLISSKHFALQQDVSYSKYIAPHPAQISLFSQ